MRHSLPAGLTLCCLLSPIAAADELPARKPGYWEMTMHLDAAGKAPAIVVHICIDAATDKAMMIAGAATVANLCKTTTPQKVESSYSWDSECAVGKMTTRNHIKVSGDFQSAYSLTMSGETSANGAVKKTSILQTFKWLTDSCPSGLKPGDMETPGGIIQLTPGG